MRQLLKNKAKILFLLPISNISGLQNIQTRFGRYISIMGACNSAQKTKPNSSQTDAKVRKTVQNQPCSKYSSQFKAIECKMATGEMNEAPKKDSKITNSNAQKNEICQLVSNLPKKQLIQSKFDQKEGAPMLQNKSLMQDRKNAAQFKKQQISAAQSTKLQHSQIRQSRNLLSHSQNKVNVEMPEDPAPKSFHNPTENNRIFGSSIRKIYEEGVIAIAEQPSYKQSDQKHQLIKKKSSIFQEVAVQPASKVSGFVWHDKIGKLSIIH